MNEIKLTRFSHGAGCGCKIAPKILDAILASNACNTIDPRLLVGNSTRDDAAVYDTGNGQAIVSTTDFFMPIVDDAFDFGAIASANAISDIYAMGAKPLMAIAILGWPVEKIPVELASQVIAGSNHMCKEAGIPLAGGHSIDSPEPIFGLAVTGIVDKGNLKTNSNAKEGSHLFLTKKLGVGIVTTAEKKGLAHPDHLEEVKKSMKKLNDLGIWLGQQSGVNCLTDVTGFGLLGHLSEVCESSGVSAEIFHHAIPVFDFLEEYIDQGCIPGGTARNWESYGDTISLANEDYKWTLADPQTSGGLLISVDQSDADHIIKELMEMGYDLKPIGKIIAKKEKKIYVRD